MCIKPINTEDIDCVIVTIQVIRFVEIDECDGSIKGEHKLVGNCFSINLRTKVTPKLIQKKMNLLC